ncbi:nucleotide exchange factor GrpE [Mesoplasma photuris]|uniref:nucleotide exchange factor GrpE n=1 Tax=Mesoplasma photuris TaxID=217731 RepID=UPI0004E1D037|nr:nucleotide exchange factor GrpE [Mesoplasma photuris]
MNKEIKKILDKNIEDKDTNKKVADYIKELEKTATELSESLEEAKLMKIAEVQNLTRRYNDERRSLKQYGAKGLAEGIITPLDLLKKVVAMPNESPEVKNYLMGFEMIIKQLEHVLEENGISEISVKVGDEFNADIHNANEAIEGTDFKENQIVEVISNGYKLYDQVLVHAIVKVAK